MATAKTKAEAYDFTTPFKEFTDLVRENYFNGIDFTFSLLDQNQKAFNARVDQVFDLEKEYVDSVSQFHKDLPKGLFPFVNGSERTVKDQIASIVNIKKSQVESYRAITDKFSKDTKTVVTENVEKAFSVFDDYLKMFK